MKDLQLPSSLLEAITKEIQNVPRQKLSVAAKNLSSKYRSQEEHKTPPIITSDDQRLAYMAVRLPATFAAVSSVLGEIQNIIPLTEPTSLKDIGSGPGTATFACLNTFPSIKATHFYEQDSGWISLSKQLLKNYSPDTTATWSNVNIANVKEFPSSDMSIISYAIGELSLEEANCLIDAVWKSTTQILVIIEPGTPRGFSYINRVRDLLISNGAFIVAPCPHQNKCPMQNPDWCHFSCRLNRTEMHLQIKDVDRGFEDEKFSYIVVAKAQAKLPYARILRHPEHHSGHTGVVLCTPEGIKKETISRKQGARYKAAKKASWGDTLSPTAES